MKKLPSNYQIGIIALSMFFIFGILSIADRFYTDNYTNNPLNESFPEVLGISGDQYKCTANVNCPSDVLDLTNWKITLPIGSNESPIEVKPTDKSPQIPIKEFKHDEYFHLNADKSGVIFKAHAGGTTTSGSGYPRSELRERVNNGAEDANWTSSSGKHAMYIEQAVLNLPVKKPHVVVGQIHAKKKGSSRNDDIVVFRLEGKKLYINADGTSNDVVLTENYELGTKFSVGLEVQNNKIKFYYNGNLVNHVMDSEFTNSYFKAGMYTQSNCRDNGEFPEDACDAYGESVIYKLKVCKDQNTICGMENDTPPPTGNQAPVSVIKTSTVSGNAPLTVNFDGTDSSDPEGGTLTYVWDFGNGLTSSSSKPSYKYNSVGVYTASLTVKDNKGATNTSTKAITVTSSTSTNQPPVAVITAQPTSGQAPLTVSLSAARSTDSDGSIVSYQWDLDDNSNPSGVAISHVYSKARTYKVKLTVKDNKGASSSVTQNITVEASTSGTANSVIGVYKSASQTLKYTFDGSNSTSSTGSIASYRWEFGDGKTSSSKKLDYTYSKAGTYKIMLTVTNSSGAKSTTYMTIVVGD